MNPLQQFIADRTPDGWQTRPFWSLFQRVKNTGYPEEELLSVYRDYGVIPKSSRDDNHNKESEDLSGYQLVDKGYLVTNKMKAWQGSIAISRYRGIVSPAYYVYKPLSTEHDDQFLHYLLRSENYIALYGRISKGVRVNQWDLEHEALRNIPILFPSRKRQKEIADFLDRETARIDHLIEKKWSLIETFPLRVEALIDKALSASDTKWLRFGYAAKMVFRAVNRQDNEPYIAIGLYNRGRGIFHKEETYGQDLGDSTFSWIKPNDLIFSGQFAWEGAVALASEREDNKIASHRYPIYNARDGIESAYLFSYFRTHRGKFLMNDCSRGAAGRNRPLNTNRLEKEQIPIPSSSLQKQVAALVQQEDILKAKITESIQALNAYKASLVTEAVTGQLDIHAWQRRGTGDRKLDQIERNTEQEHKSKKARA